MKATNEQNRLQKDWLDNLEKRMGYAWQDNQTDCGALLFRRLDNKIAAEKVLLPSPDLPLPIAKTYEPKFKPNMRVNKPKRPYHHTF